LPSPLGRDLLVPPLHAQDSQGQCIDTLFGFDGASTKSFFVEGSDFGKARLLGSAGRLIKFGEVFEVAAIRRGDTLSFKVNGQEIYSGKYRLPEPCPIGLRPWRATLRIYDFSAAGSLFPVRD
jgi:hypothetical protein